MVGRTPTFTADPLGCLFGDGKRLNTRQERDEGVPRKPPGQIECLPNLIPAAILLLGKLGGIGF